MKLIEFIEPDGSKIYINPALVLYVCADAFHEGVSIIAFRGNVVRVKGSPSDVASDLIRGHSV